MKIKLFLNAKNIVTKKFQNRDVAVSVRKGWCSLFQYKGKLIIFFWKNIKHQSWSPGHKSTSSVRPTAPIHGGDPHGGAGAAHPVSSYHRLVQGSSEVLSYHHQDQALAGIVLQGDAGSSHQDSRIWKGRPFLLISTKLHQVQSVTFSMLVQYQCSTCFYTLVYTEKQHLTWVLLLRINADFQPALRQ